MTWWCVNEIPENDGKFQKIIENLLFQCPSSIENRIKDGNYANGKKKYKKTYLPISARGCSFRERGIRGDLFRTLLAQVKNYMKYNGTFQSIDCKESVGNTVVKLISESSFSDPDFELAVFNKRSNMSIIETYFYYIRNAFAHGAFEVKRNGKKTIYLLENKNSKGEIKAQMRLNESTLLKYATLVHLKPSEIKNLRK